MPTSAKQPSDNAGKRNPLYIKIGKRIRQARLMAKQTNSRDLSIRLGWSAGRLHNYETGLSTPGVEETLQFCEAVGVEPGWITYGVGAPRPTELHSARYRNFIDALDDAEKGGYLEEYLEAIKLSVERMRKFRNNPYARIPDVMARRCEKYLGQRRGWIDRTGVTREADTRLDAGSRALLELYVDLSPQNKDRLIAMGELLRD